MTFGERLKEARKKKGLTQKQLAAMIGAKHNSVSDWEVGKVMPYPDTIGYIMWALDVDANYFFGEREESKPEPTMSELYDQLDEHGKAVVDAVLQLEVKRMEDLNGKE